MYKLIPSEKGFFVLHAWANPNNRALSYSQYYISQMVVGNNDSEGSVFSLKAPPTSSRCSLEPSTQALTHFGCNMSTAELAAIMAWLSVTWFRFLSASKVIIGTLNKVNAHILPDFLLCQEWCWYEQLESLGLLRMCSWLSAIVRDSTSAPNSHLHCTEMWRDLRLSVLLDFFQMIKCPTDFSYWKILLVAANSWYSPWH